MGDGDKKKKSWWSDLSVDHKLKVLELCVAAFGALALLLAALVAYQQFSATNTQIQHQIMDSVKQTEAAQFTRIEERYQRALELFMDNRTTGRVAGTIALANLAMHQENDENDPYYPFLPRVLNTLTVYLREPSPSDHAQDSDRYLRRLVFKTLIDLFRQAPREFSSPLDLTEVRLIGVRLDNIDLSDVDLSRSNLTGASFRGCLFSKTILRQTILDRAVFDSALLFNDVDMSSARGKSPSFQYVLMLSVNFHSSSLLDANFFGSTIKNATFVETTLVRPNLICVIDNATFSSARLISPVVGTGPYSDFRGVGVEVRQAEVDNLRSSFSSQLLYYPIAETNEEQ